jgi:hypothetical protein
MVRAWLAGTKRMTRRLAWGPRFQKAIDDEGGYPGHRWSVWTPGQCSWPSGKSLVRMGLPPDTKQLIGHMAPSAWQNVKPGDRLWIRENALYWMTGSAKAGTLKRTKVAAYQADGYELEDGERWTSCLHMPRAFSRITLIVGAVRIERLQDIKEADCIAEGADNRLSARAWYRELWGSLHGAGAWDANPYVVAISCKAIQSNIDAPGPIPMRGLQGFWRWPDAREFAP